jgi:FKBP-type peptidyl-prolyl cis-trans isomerase 2
MVVEVEKAQLPEDLEPEVGVQLQLNQPDGQAIPVQITAVNEEKVTLDANHPLAGQDLTFEIEVVEIA